MTLTKNASAKTPPLVSGDLGKVPQKKIRMSLPAQVMIGLILGVAWGVFFGELSSWLKVIGDIFVKLLQITVIPYISLSLITGIGGLSYNQVRAHAKRGGSIWLLISAITLMVVMLMPLSFPNWSSASFFSIQQLEEPPTVDFLRMFIPSNPAHAYANALVPAIVVFSILVGIALIGMPERDALIRPLEVFHATMMKITGMIAKLSPFGVFALIASTTGTSGVEDLTRLQVYIIVYILTALTLSLILLPGIIMVFTQFRYRDIVKALHAPLITAFATGSALIVLPMLIEQCKQLIAYQGRLAINQEDADASIEMLVPSFFTFPSPMGLLSLSFVLYAGWYIGSNVSVTAYPLIVLAGVPSLFGGPLLTIPFLLNQLRLPSDLFHVFVSINVIISRFGTLVSVMHYTAIGLIGTMALAGQTRLRWSRLKLVALVSVVLILPVILGVRAFYSYVVIAPYVKDDILKRMHFLDSPQPAKNFTEVPEMSDGQSGTPIGLAGIEKRGVLKVCYQPDEYPSAFFNTADPPQLVGFDIEMAHRFAKRLQLPLEFLPAETESAAEDLLNRGICDIYMRTLPVEMPRSRRFELSAPIYRSSMGFIVKDHRRNEFQSWENIRKLRHSLRIGVEDTPGSIARLHMFTANDNIVPIESMEEQLKLLKSGDESIDAIADMAEEGAALTILYPDFELVVPKPAVFFPVAYAVASGNNDLVKAFNTWLLAQRSEGAVDQLYRHWMLGGAAEAEEAPRWSVIRNVLGWVD